MKIELDFSGKSPPLCKHCKRQKGSHKAQTHNCPIGRGNFPQYKSNQFYEPKETK